MLKRKTFNETRKGQRFIEAVRQMPPLYMKQPGQEYELSKNEVAQWLLKQPSAADVLLDLVTKNHWIIFDRGTHLWHGASEDETNQAEKPNQKWIKSVQEANRRKRLRTQQELRVAYNRLTKANWPLPVTLEDLSKELKISQPAVYQRIKQNNILFIDEHNVVKVK